MTNAALARDAGHVEAYCSTGTSPGTLGSPAHSGLTRCRLDFDYQGTRDVEVSYEVHGPVHAPTTLLSFDTDALVPPWLVEELAQQAHGVCEHIRLSSPYGHDAFLKEHEQVSSVLRAATECREVVR